MRPEDRDILRECDIDVVLCLDEFRTTLQSRNSVCFGMTALIENMFTTSSLPKEVGCKFVRLLLPFFDRIVFFFILLSCLLL